jgi:tetratricopeptide (TPR) repeat protein
MRECYADVIETAFVRGTSMKALLAALLFAAFASMGATAALAAEDATRDQIAEAMRLVTVGSMQMKSSQTDEALASFLAALDQPGFEALPDNVRLSALVRLSILEMEEQPEAAFRRYRAALEDFRQIVVPYHFTLLAYFAVENRDRAAALDALDMLVTTYADPEYYWMQGTIEKVLYSTRGDASLAERRHRLMEAIWESGSAPTEPFARQNQFWFELLTSYVERGEDEKARDVAARLNSPNLVAALRFDKRFERLGAIASAKGFALTQQKELAWARQLVVDHPQLLEAANQLANVLIDMGEFDEALHVAETALARTEDPAALPFEDLEDHLHWLHDLQARALFRLGRYDDAVAAETAALETSENDDVSHHVNLGIVLLSLDRPAEALAVLDKAGSGSHFGKMAVEQARACAHALLGNETEFERSLDYLKSYKNDGFNALLTAMLCDNRLDEIAPLLIEQIETPDTRTNALLDLQDFTIRPNLTAFETEMERRKQSLLTRPDVRATIERHGRILSWPAVSWTF